MRRTRARPRSAAAPTASCAGRCARWARCWRPGASIPAAARAVTCAPWRRAMPSRAPGWTRCSGSSAWQRPPTGGARRLGVAAALLGDPGVLLLDEPVNGLDPEGIRWIRGLLQSTAARGHTILVSSHLISEMALMAGDLVVIGQGRLLAQTTVAGLSAGAESLEEAFLQLTSGTTDCDARQS